MTAETPYEARRVGRAAPVGLCLPCQRRVDGLGKARAIHRVTAQDRDAQGGIEVRWRDRIPG